MGNGQKEKEIREMMKHPAPGKKVGIVHLHMVREQGWPIKDREKN